MASYTLGKINSIYVIRFYLRLFYSLQIYVHKKDINVSLSL
jgi:hypothetical protein